jgi:hypothetical protein
MTAPKREENQKKSSICSVLTILEEEVLSREPFYNNQTGINR